MIEIDLKQRRKKKHENKKLIDTYAGVADVETLSSEENGARERSSS